MATPNGSLEMTVDELNRVYKTPIYCFATPVNMITTISTYPLKKELSNQTQNMESHTINLKIRINPGDFNINITANTANSILELKQLIVKLSKHQVNLFFFFFLCLSIPYDSAFFFFLFFFFPSSLHSIFLHKYFTVWHCTCFASLSVHSLFKQVHTHIKTHTHRHRHRHTHTHAHTHTQSHTHSHTHTHTHSVTHTHMTSSPLPSQSISPCISHSPTLFPFFLL